MKPLYGDANDIQKRAEEHEARVMQQNAPCFSQTAIPKDNGLKADQSAEDRPYRWTIEPHPYDRSYDTFVTDDDNAAREALLALWDGSADHPKFSCVFDGAVASTQQSSEASHRPELSQDSPASGPKSSSDTQLILAEIRRARHRGYSRFEFERQKGCGYANRA